MTNISGEWKCSVMSNPLWPQGLGCFPARILELVAISSSRWSSWPRNRTRMSPALQADSLLLSLLYYNFQIMFKQSFKIKTTIKSLPNECFESCSFFFLIQFSFLNFHRQIRGLRIKDNICWIKYQNREFWFETIKSLVKSDLIVKSWTYKWMGQRSCSWLTESTWSRTRMTLVW